MPLSINNLSTSNKVYTPLLEPSEEASNRVYIPSLKLSKEVSNISI